MSQTSTITMGLVLDIISKIDRLTIGEITELFNSEYPDLALPRNELAKRVSALKKEGKVQPVNLRRCSVGGKLVMEWSASPDSVPTDSILEKARLELERAKRRYEEAAAQYEALASGRKAQL